MDEWKYWVALKMVDGVGDVLIRNLLSEFGSPEAVFGASLARLKNVDGIGEKTAQALKNFSSWHSAEREVEEILKSNFKLIPFTSASYPNNLRNVYSPPSLIYIKGEILPEDDNAIAIVGTRISNRYGRSVAERLAEELAARGVTVVSGMARGIDSVAHWGALKRKGRTIAVLGSGLDVIYPPENKKLYGMISKQGSVVSEFPLGTAPQPGNFPKRNRIISGLALGVLVVQASEKSGSLITASFALQQNREVFAVPGKVGSKLSRGTHSLIKQGAKLVESVDDIVCEIDAFRRLDRRDVKRDIFASYSNLSEEEKAVYSLFDQNDEPLHVDEIIKLTGIDSAKILSTLLSLELYGLLEQLPGMVFKTR